MPSTLISTPAGWLDDPQRLIDAVQDAVVETLNVSPENRLVRLLQLPAESFALPPTSSGRHVLVEVTLYPGRTNDQKQAFYAAARRNLAPLGVGEGDLRVALIEVPPENWV